MMVPVDRWRSSEEEKKKKEEEEDDSCSLPLFVYLACMKRPGMEDEEEEGWTNKSFVKALFQGKGTAMHIYTKLWLFVSQERVGHGGMGLCRP